MLKKLWIFILLFFMCFSFVNAYSEDDLNNSIMEVKLLKNWDKYIDIIDKFFKRIKIIQKNCFY